MRITASQRTAERCASPTIRDCDDRNMESGVATGQRYDDATCVAEAARSRGCAPLAHAAAERHVARHRGARPARAARRRSGGEDARPWRFLRAPHTRQRLRRCGAWRVGRRIRRRPHRTREDQLPAHARAAEDTLRARDASWSRVSRTRRRAPPTGPRFVRRHPAGRPSARHG